jgi:hypothetical protein
LKRWWKDDALMWTDAAISSTVTGCAKWARIQDTALATRASPCDGRDETDEPASLASGAAGWPFFGQFVAHDITADRSTPQVRADLSQLRNARSPRLNLEGLYGDGPVGHPFLFQRDDPAKLLTAQGGRDLLRNAEGTAIIGDPRNDSHVIMSQLHLAFVHAHNAFVDRARAAGQPEALVFATAARELVWHYQTVVLREFLPSLIGAELTDLIMRGDRRYYRPRDEPFIPLEFADAAYRYGHSQIRHTYQLNSAGGAVPIFPDLLGFRPVAVAHHIEWPRLFDAVGAPPALRAKKIDGRLVGALIAFAGVSVPDNPLITAAIEYAQRISEPICSIMRCVRGCSQKRLAA